MGEGDEMISIPFDVMIQNGMTPKNMISIGAGFLAVVLDLTKGNQKDLMGLVEHLLNKHSFFTASEDDKEGLNKAIADFDMKRRGLFN